jgi:hypothetical protein
VKFHKMSNSIPEEVKCQLHDIIALNPTYPPYAGLYKTKVKLEIGYLSDQGRMLQK